MVIGLDRSASAHHALTWAAREAARRHATLLVVTAWPAVDRIGARDNGELVHHRVRLHRMQRDAVAAATAGPANPPQVAREMAFADPVTTLCHAAGFADLVVLGGDATGGLRPRSVAAGVATRLARHRRGGEPAPIVVVSTRGCVSMHRSPRETPVDAAHAAAC
ncbi:hypothetical protein DLJ59_15830 [Micromonospora inaquosa]|uniref:UspA domain-containing protein n=1 Tax=Micromonospora inaquosa TaxID=2203716 RepID=A0A3N9WN99_9ACTN|nr:hypothetical protein DLJ59_15830 [Micromonospora inaquosa]